MISAEMLPVLHLRRQAATYGWRFTGANTEGYFFYRRTDEDGNHELHVYRGYLPKRGESFEKYESATFHARTSDGELYGNHMAIRQIVGALRVYAGYPEVSP